MQCDIKKIFKCCETRSMELIREKSKVMHLGKQTNPENCLIARKKLGVIECKRDFRLI